MRGTSDKATTFEKGWNRKGTTVTNGFQSTEWFVVYLEHG